jgi:hypothetical protein
MARYFATLRDINKNILGQVAGFNSQIKAITHVQLYISAILVVAGIALGIQSLSLVLNSADLTLKENFAYLTFCVGLLLLLAAYLNNPGKRLQKHLRNALQMNVVLMGFLSKINEIEAAYLKYSKGNANKSTLDDTIKHVQEAIDRASVGFEQMEIDE